MSRWPTFGLQLADAEYATTEGQIDLPDQDASRQRQSYHNSPGASALGLITRILRTRARWSDTLESSTPGLRGRIATIPMTPGDSPASLFMPPEVIARVAFRGEHAGRMLLHRFTGQHEDEAPGFTRADRYRWIRLRMALREWREIAIRARVRAPLYRERISRYPIPSSLGDWFTGPNQPPMNEPYTEQINGTIDQLSELAHTHLAEEFDGTPPGETRQFRTSGRTVTVEDRRGSVADPPTESVSAFAR